jgi:hypothetical protein
MCRDEFKVSSGLSAINAAVWHASVSRASPGTRAPSLGCSCCPTILGQSISTEVFGQDHHIVSIFWQGA